MIGLCAAVLQKMKPIPESLQPQLAREFLEYAQRGLDDPLQIDEVLTTIEHALDDTEHGRVWLTLIFTTDFPLGCARSKPAVTLRIWKRMVALLKTPSEIKRVAAELTGRDTEGSDLAWKLALLSQLLPKMSGSSSEKIAVVDLFRRAIAVPDTAIERQAAFSLLPQLMCNASLVPSLLPLLADRLADPATFDAAWKIAGSLLGLQQEPLWDQLVVALLGCAAKIIRSNRVPSHGAMAEVVVALMRADPAGFKRNFSTISTDKEPIETMVRNHLAASQTSKIQLKMSF